MEHVRTIQALRKTGVTLTLALLVALLVALLSLASLAAQDSPVAIDEAGSSPTGSEWPLEVGVYYMNDVPGTSHDLLGADDYAYGLWNRLRSSGWCNFSGNDCFIWGNSNAWEEDFKRHDRGGTNNEWVDDVDLTFYVGHGNPSYFTFDRPTGPCTHDDRYLTYQDAYLAWGDRDLEWMALLSCQVLADSHERDWVWTMNRLHLLLGFETNAWIWHYPTSANNFGYLFAKYITWDWRIPTAWFVACDQAMLPGMRAKVLAEEYNHFYDRQSYQYPDAWDWWYHRWEHKCGCEPARQVDFEQVGDTMPIFETPALSLAERDEAWGTLTGAFELPNQAVSLNEDPDIWTSSEGGRELQMDTANGLFYYIDHNNLFSLTHSAENPILPMQDPQAIADQFLTENDLMPGDAQFYEVVNETMEDVYDEPGVTIASAAGPAEAVTTTLSNYQVIYSRILTYTPPSPTGIEQEPIEFSVVGAGAKLKVYVEPTSNQATVSSPQQGTGAVSGAMGGWRRIQQPQPMAVQETVEILPFEKVEQLFYQLEPQTAFAYMPVDDIVDKKILSYTLGYWEESLGAGQDQLYPAYVISAAYTSTIEVNPFYVVSDYAYFPANPTYASPLARIESHSDLSQNLMPGDVFTATASDASQPLNALGYHELLDFPLGSGELYLYNWYLGSVADENWIGGGRELTYDVQKFSGSFHDTPVPQTIFLVVTDEGSAHASRNTASDSVAYHIIPPVYVPIVFRSH